MTSIQATTRNEKGSRACRALRASGSVPAVLYGGAEKESLAISLNSRDFVKAWREAGESTVLTITGLGADKSVLIQDVSVDPLHGTPVHVDLLAVRTDQVVEVEVPLQFVGVAPAEKEMGGTLVKVMHELTIEALPKDLPHEIEVSIETLATFEDQILVKDVTLPAGVKAVADAEEVVALVQAARTEEEEPVQETTDLSAVEVEKKGKTEEDQTAE